MSNKRNRMPGRRPGVQPGNSMREAVRNQLIFLIKAEESTHCPLKWVDSLIRCCDELRCLIRAQHVIYLKVSMENDKFSAECDDMKL